MWGVNIVETEVRNEFLKMLSCVYRPVFVVYVEVGFSTVIYVHGEGSSSRAERKRKMASLPDWIWIFYFLPSHPLSDVVFLLKSEWTEVYFSELNLSNGLRYIFLNWNWMDWSVYNLYFWNFVISVTLCFVYTQIYLLKEVLVGYIYILYILRWIYVNCNSDDNSNSTI